MENKKDSISKKFNLYYVFVAAVVLLGVVLIVNILQTFSINKELQKKAEVAKENLKPAKVELTLIKNSKCTDCFDISTIVSHIKNANVDVTKETMFEYDSIEGKEIITKYKIEKIPTVVVTGEIEKVNIQGLEKKENGLLLTRLEPPYTNALTGQVEGKVKLYLLKDPDCKKCNDLNILILQIKGAGVKIYEEKNITPASDEGKELISKYKIDFVPALVLSKDAGIYPIVQQAWPQIGSKEEDAYVLRAVSPPYINLTTGKLSGLVNAIYLTDKSCPDCYNVNTHKEILTSPQSFAIKFENEETLDISDAKGKVLISKYNITQAPTIILSDEVSAYPSSQGLRQFFSIEKDGFYVFRAAQVLGAYKDLTKNEVVKPQQSEEVHG